MATPMTLPTNQHTSDTTSTRLNSSRCSTSVMRRSTQSGAGSGAGSGSGSGATNKGRSVTVSRSDYSREPSPDWAALAANQALGVSEGGLGAGGAVGAVGAVASVLRVCGGVYVVPTAVGVVSPGLWASSLRASPMSVVALRNSRMALPSPAPSSGSRDGPKRIRAIAARIRRTHQCPRPGMNGYLRDVRTQSIIRSLLLPPLVRYPWPPYGEGDGLGAAGEADPVAAGSGEAPGLAAPDAGLGVVTALVWIAIQRTLSPVTSRRATERPAVTSPNRL